jgi:hypothetical protein
MLFPIAHFAAVNSRECGSLPSERQPLAMDFKSTITRLPAIRIISQQKTDVLAAIRGI